MAIDWREIADRVWQGSTVPQACEAMGLDWGDTYREMRDPDFRRLFVDISMVASVRDEMLGEMENASTADDS